MAQDLAAERLPAGEAGQRAVIDEGLDANDRVVPPVLPVAQLPVVEAGREHRAVHPAGELLHAREQRAAVHGRGGGLDHADARVALHELDQADDRLAGHQAVGVEHDHVAVAPAPAPAEVGDVAALALQAHLAAAIEDAAEAPHGATPVEPRFLLLHRRARVGRVAEHEEVEAVERAGALERAMDRAEPREHPLDRLLADGHHDGREDALGRDHRRVAAGTLEVGDREAIPAADEGEEAEHGGPEADRDPPEEGAKEGRDRHLEPGAPLVGQDVHHELARDEGGDQHEETEEEAAPECDARPWKPPAHPVEQAAVERPVGRGGRRPLAAAAEETAQEAALDRLRDHRPAAELGHRAQQPVPGGSLRPPARRVAPRRAPPERPREAPGEEAVGGALGRGGSRALLLHELAERAQRLRERVSRPLPRLRQGALDRPGRERSVLLRVEPERRKVGERARVDLPPVVEDAAPGHGEVAVARRADRSPRSWIAIHRGTKRAGSLLAHGRIT